MTNKRILFYAKIVLTMIVSMVPFILSIDWLWEEYGYKIDWKPFLAIGAFVAAGLISICGIVLSGMAAQSLYKEIKADLLDNKLKKDGKTLCRSCYGRGCRNCNQQGYKDWISNIVGVKNTFNDGYAPPQQGPSRSTQSGRTL